MMSSGYAKISHSTVATVQSEKEATRCKYVPPVSGQGVSDLESRYVKLIIQGRSNRWGR